jgi:predicted deacylase
MQRSVFEDDKDLNRCFEVEKITTYSEYYAQLLTEKFFAACDFGIDVHDSG